MTHAQAILLSIVLVIGTVFFIQKTRSNEPVVPVAPPAPVVDVPVAPVTTDTQMKRMETLLNEQAKVIDTIRQIAADARSALQLLAKSNLAIDAGAKAWVNYSGDSDNVKTPDTTDTLPKGQVILHFYDRDSEHVYAQQLISEGHKVYSVSPDRLNVYKYFGVDRRPTWIVLRNGKTIYQSSIAPRFAAAATTYTAPTYTVPRYYYQGNSMQRPSCIGGVCQ